MPEDVTEIKTFQRSSPPSSGLLYSRSSFLKTCAAFFASKLKNFGNIFFQFPILIICKSSFHSRFWRMDLYQWRRLGRHSLIALIALLRLPRSRISNLIVGHTGIWGSRDQLSIVFALRNESKIFFGLKKILRFKSTVLRFLGRKTMQNDARLLRLLSWQIGTSWLVNECTVNTF